MLDKPPPVLKSLDNMSHTCECQQGYDCMRSTRLGRYECPMAHPRGRLVDAIPQQQMQPAPPQQQPPQQPAPPQQPQQPQQAMAQHMWGGQPPPPHTGGLPPHMGQPQHSQQAHRSRKAAGSGCVKHRAEYGGKPCWPLHPAICRSSWLGESQKLWKLASLLAHEQYFCPP